MTNKERLYAQLGLEYSEGIEDAKVVVMPSGREIRKTKDLQWEVQPPNDNYWVSFETLLEAYKFGLSGTSTQIKS